MAIDLCEGLGFQSTFFFTADFAHEYGDHIARMQALDQEIGCHGLTHNDEEDYNHMPVTMQRAYIEEATRKLEAITGAPILSFRSPRVKTSDRTLGLLTEFGYRADSSVCSQRLDFVSSNLINFNWLIAPRLPYHPQDTNAFRRGNASIWEIPISAIAIPFISNALNILGLFLTKKLFRLLYLESKHTGKPIVYLAHPVEFMFRKARRSHFTIQEFSPAYVRTHGLIIRRAFNRMNGEALYDATRELITYIGSFPRVKFMTVNQYVDYLEL
jgi:peptidoglycan-N-acetylglucosamine deacetylase